jgi:hypothetical protein
MMAKHTMRQRGRWTLHESPHEGISFIFKYTNTIGLPHTLKFRFNSTSILYHSGFTPRQYSAESAHKPKDAALEAQTQIPESPISRMFLQIIIKMESAVLSRYNNPRDNNSALLLPSKNKD